MCVPGVLISAARSDGLGSSLDRRGGPEAVLRRVARGQVEEDVVQGGGRDRQVVSQSLAQEDTGQAVRVLRREADAAARVHDLVDAQVRGDLLRGPRTVPDTG